VHIPVKTLQEYNSMFKKIPSQVEFEFVKLRIHDVFDRIFADYTIHTRFLGAAV
jgi:hypothetical protein